MSHLLTLRQELDVSTPYLHMARLAQTAGLPAPSPHIFFSGSRQLSGPKFFRSNDRIQHLDPLFHAVGLSLLTAGALEGFWTGLYNTTFWRIQRFNNTVVMGSFVTALALFLPLYLLSNLLIRKYREHVLAWMRKLKIVQAVKASSLYNIYQKVSGWGAAS